MVHYTDIPLRRNPVTLVRSVVRPRKITCPYAPSCIETPIGFKFFNRHGVEIFGTEETEPSLHPTGTPNVPSAPAPVLPFVNTAAVQDVDDPPTLSNNLFVEEHGIHDVLPTILEEEECPMDVPFDDTPLIEPSHLPCGRSDLATLVGSDTLGESTHLPITITCYI